MKYLKDPADHHSDKDQRNETTSNGITFKQMTKRWRSFSKGCN